MAKRSGETREERKERKRRKKEAKKAKPEDSPAENTLTGCFTRKHVELSISLLPSALSDVQAHLEDSVRSMLLKYSDTFEGILLSFDSLKVLQKGRILNELPNLHYRVALDGLVFTPAPQQTLSGCITESFHSHISLLIMNYFNASITAEELERCGFQFDTDLLQWYRDTEDNQMQLLQGETIQFTCAHFYVSRGIISIEGSDPRRSVKM